MKSKQQVGDSIYQVLVHKMSHPGASAFHTDARLREDLGLDSSATLQLLVLLELELGLALPEEAIMDKDFDTVRSVAKVLYDAQPRPPSDKILDYDEDIKLHCFVSCLSEVLKRLDAIEHRVFYFGVWDSEVIVTDRCTISYHSETISHQHFLDWYARLYGIEVRAWYEPSLSKDENAARLVSLVESRTPDQHIMVMLDMHRLPERVNEFNKDPFPHYLMLGPTSNPDAWMMYDPDYRWEGVIQKDRILHAMRHPAVRGGYIFSDRSAHAPQPRQIKAHYDAYMRLDENPMTRAIREVITAHLAGRDKNGNELSLAQLGAALEEVPVLSIRKYAYEHGLAFFWRELVLDEQEFEHWCEVIAQLVKTYKLVQFQAMKVSATGDRQLTERLFAILDHQDQRERQVKRRMHEVFRQWCDITFAPRNRESVSEVST